MSVLFCGDPHGDFTAVEDHLRHGPTPDAVVILGDCDLDRPLADELTVARQLKVPVFWIPGNHDSDRDHWHDNLFDGGLGTNIDGQVVEIPGFGRPVRIAGLGGIFRAEVWHPEAGPPRFRSPEDWLAAHGPNHRWRGGVARKHRTSIWWSTYERLWDQKADILVTHEAPSSMVKHRNQCIGVKAIDELAEAMGARMIVHGHHHHDYDASLPSGIQVHGVGKAEIWRWAP